MFMMLLLAEMTVYKHIWQSFVVAVQADLKTVMKELVDFQRKLDFGGSRNPMVDDDEDEGLDSNENQTR